MDEHEMKNVLVGAGLVLVVLPSISNTESIQCGSKIEWKISTSAEDGPDAGTLVIYEGQQPATLTIKYVDGVIKTNPGVAPGVGVRVILNGQAKEYGLSKEGNAITRNGTKFTVYTNHGWSSIAGWYQLPCQ